MRPRCCFLYFTFFGINMASKSPQTNLPNSGLLRLTAALPRIALARFALDRLRLQFLLPARLRRSGQRRQNRRARPRLIGGRRLHRSARFSGRRSAHRGRTTPRLAIAIPVIAVPARHTPWFRLIAQTARARAFQNLALIHPALHSDNAVRGMRLGETVIDIGAKRVQRQLPLQIPLAARDLVSVQTARNPDLNSLAAEPQRGIDRLAHRSPERHAFFQLQRNRLGHKLRFQFRLMHFLNVDEHFALGALGEIALQLLDLRAFASDDDARPRCADRHAKLIAWAVDFNRAQAGRLEASMQGLLQLDVFAEQLRVIRLREPPRPPGLGDAQPESIWMYFLSHALPTCSLRSSPGRRL